jgi:hypothetical protein
MEHSVRASKVTDLMNRQANDDGLWFRAQTAPEGYLQQELRALHAAIEAQPAVPVSALRALLEKWTADMWQYVPGPADARCAEQRLIDELAALCDQAEQP